MEKEERRERIRQLGRWLDSQVAGDASEAEWNAVVEEREALLAEEAAERRS